MSVQHINENVKLNFFGYLLAKANADALPRTVSKITSILSEPIIIKIFLVNILSLIYNHEFSRTHWPDYDMQ